MDNRLCASFSFCAGTNHDTFDFERSLLRSGYSCVAGVDEAGRGPLAGPVVAGCVVLPLDCEYQQYKDSKKLTAADRDNLFDLLHDCGARIGFGIASHEEIDLINILRASLEAMARAVAHCAESEGPAPDFLLVDGKFTAPVALPQQALVKGESKSASIAAASIIAKVVRDRLMAEYHEQFPEYNFLHNKGYATEDHRRAISLHGPCPIHRRTFKGVREYLPPDPKQNKPKQKGLW